MIEWRRLEGVGCSSASAKRYRSIEVRFGVREERWEVSACDSSEGIRLKVMLCLDWVRERLNDDGGVDVWASAVGFNGEETKVGLTV